MREATMRSIGGFQLHRGGLCRVMLCLINLGHRHHLARLHTVAISNWASVEKQNGGSSWPVWGVLYLETVNWLSFVGEGLTRFLVVLFFLLQCWKSSPGPHGSRQVLLYQATPRPQLWFLLPSAAPSRSGSSHPSPVLLRLPLSVLWC